MTFKRKIQSEGDNFGSLLFAAGAVDRHSITLMTAFQLLDDFHKVAEKLPDLVTELLDSNLVATESLDETKEDHPRRLLRLQLGVKDAFQPDNMLERFAAGMNKLAQDGGLTLLDGNTGNPDLNEVSKALTAFAMQMYYEDTANATNAGKELFTTENITGGIRFDLADVSTKIKAALETGEAATLSDAKGYDLYFSKYLLQEHAGFTAEESHQIKSWLPYMRDWYVQAGASGMNATDTLNRGAFMLGGDSMKAEAANDKQYAIQFERKAA